jgi:hypothetical protein
VVTEKWWPEAEGVFITVVQAAVYKKAEMEVKMAGPGVHNQVVAGVVVE